MTLYHQNITQATFQLNTITFSICLISYNLAQKNYNKVYQFWLRRHLNNFKCIGESNFFLLKITLALI